MSCTARIMACGSPSISAAASIGLDEELAPGVVGAVETSSAKTPLGPRPGIAQDSMKFRCGRSFGKIAEYSLEGWRIAEPEISMRRDGVVSYSEPVSFNQDGRNMRYVPIRNQQSRGISLGRHTSRS